MKPLALVPRTLESTLARYAAPEAPGHARDETLDQALLVTTATELRALKLEVQALRGIVLAQGQKIKELSHMASA